MQPGYKQKAQNIKYKEVGTNMCAKPNYTAGKHKKTGPCRQRFHLSLTYWNLL